MSKHTPGPWRYDAEGFAIMTWDGVQVVDLLGAMEGEDATADAHLIAAAPDLLEAILDIRSFLCSRGYDTRIVDSAIAKAEGREVAS